MDATNRGRTCAQLQRDNKQAWGGILKPQLQAAVDAIDDFLINNATTVNNAFPVAAKAALSTQEKLLVIAYVTLRRAGKLKAEED
jgi:hypothetical protein